MHQRWQIAQLRAALARQWRIRDARCVPSDLAGPLELRPLEERRVLSASAALALAQALASSGMEQVEGTNKTPDPASPLGTDVAHHDPIDPGDRVVVGNSNPASNQSQDSKGPAANNLEETENRSVTLAINIDKQNAAPESVAQEGVLATPAASPLQAPLTITVSPAQSTHEGSLLSITDIGKFTDPTLEGEPYSYSIDWGDGRPADTGMATIDSFGGDGMPLSGSFDGAHVYADNGTYTVTVTITSSTGQTANDKFAVSVSNVAPTLSVVPNQVTSEGTLLSITDLGKFSDPGFNNPLNVGGEVTEKFTYAINWGDGTPVQSGPGTIDVAGSPGVPTQGSFNGSHTYADNGVYTVTVTLIDDDGGKATQTFQVTVANVAPTLTVAANQTVNEGSLLSITNIGQFTDPGFDNPLNSGGELSEKFTYSINWGDGTPVTSGTPTIDIPGGPGTPTQGSFDGSHIYADNGVYTVTVTVSDDDGGKATQMFTIVVNNVAPVLTVPTDQVVDEGSLLAITNIGQFTDPGFNNPLNVGGEVSEKFTYAINWGDGTPVSSGSPTIDIPGGPGTPTQGSFDGSHIYADNGVYTVTVTVSDDDGGKAVQTFSVTVRNVAPTLTVPPDQVADAGVSLSLPNIGQFTDPGFDNPLNVGGELTERFTYAVDWGDGSPISSGPATIDLPGGPGVSTQGSFDGAHTYAAPGSYTVTVTVLDDDGGKSSATFQVTVRNVAPILISGPNQSVDEGAPLSVTDIGTFTDPYPGAATTYSYSIDWGDGLPVDSGVATIDSSGEGPTHGSFDGGHTYADNGIYTVTISILTSDGRSASQTLSVNVANVAPTLIVGGNFTIPLGQILSLQNIGQFSDPGFDNALNLGGETTERFTFSVNWGDGTPLNSGAATIDAAGAQGLRTAGSFDAQHIYGATGNFTVTVTVADDDGGVAVGTFEVTVYILRPTTDGLYLPTGGGGGGAAPPPGSGTGPEPRLQPPQRLNRIDFVGARAASVAGAEPRLVLRIVTPDGIEDRLNEEPLANEVLDNLRGLFKRLPNGQYRIYQIQPDGVERLVVDVTVREGHSVEPQAGLPEEPPAAKPLPEKDPTPAEVETAPTADSEAKLPLSAAEVPTDSQDRESQAAAVVATASGIALVAGSTNAEHSPQRRPARLPPLSKAHRIFRRLR